MMLLDHVGVRSLEQERVTGALGPRSEISNCSRRRIENLGR